MCLSPVTVNRNLPEVFRMKENSEIRVKNKIEKKELLDTLSMGGDDCGILELKFSKILMYRTHLKIIFLHSALMQL